MIVFDNKTGMWEFCRQGQQDLGGNLLIKQICSDNDSLLMKYERDRKNDGFRQTDEGYGCTLTLMNKVPKILPTLQQIRDPFFISDREKSSWQKILYRNGIYT